jgi:hypothetical protein
VETIANGLDDLTRTIYERWSFDDVVIKTAFLRAAFFGRLETLQLLAPVSNEYIHEALCLVVNGSNATLVEYSLEFLVAEATRVGVELDQGFRALLATIARRHGHFYITERHIPNHFFQFGIGEVSMMRTAAIQAHSTQIYRSFVSGFFDFDGRRLSLPVALTSGNIEVVKILCEQYSIDTTEVRDLAQRLSTEYESTSLRNFDGILNYFNERKRRQEAIEAARAPGPVAREAGRVARFMFEPRDRTRVQCVNGGAFGGMLLCILLAL